MVDDIDVSHLRVIESGVRMALTTIEMMLDDKVDIRSGYYVMLSDLQQARVECSLAIQEYEDGDAEHLRES